MLLNGQSLYHDLDALRGYVAHIPQEDAFDEHLTIEENLEFAAAIRAPHLTNSDRSRRIDGKLVELGLSERRNNLVGSPTNKVLSGGERKRLNIGLDMIGNADIFLFDEPTSGLSSKDAEHVIDIIRSMAHNKIVLVTIHQPTSKIFQMFSKALLLDKGGKLVFFGTPHEMLEYFASAEHEQQFGTELGGCPACGTTRPEFIFDVLETPLRDLSGDIIYEENIEGQLIPARRYSPDYWRDKYESFRLLQDMRQVAVRKQTPATLPPASVKRADAIRGRDEWTQFRTLLKRAFISKMRIRGNLFITIVAAPLLAALVGVVLRYSPNSTYDFASAVNIPTYLFISLVVAMFLGLTNSSDDIIRDRIVLQRERNLNVRLPYYIFAKTSTLALFAALQCALFVLVGNAILEIRGMFWAHFLINFITALAGIAMGLFISSLVEDGKTAANIVPLILIPNIILGGALIKYEDMNHDLDFRYTHPALFLDAPARRRGPRRKRRAGPDHLRVHPDALELRGARGGPGQAEPAHLAPGRDPGADRQAGQSATAVTDAQFARLDDLKDTLAYLSGLESTTVDDIEDRIRKIDKIIQGAPLDAGRHPLPSRPLHGREPLFEPENHRHGLESRDRPGRLPAEPSRSTSSLDR